MSNLNISFVAKSISVILPTGDAIFSNVSLALTDRIYGLVGSNGVGKSTLAKTLAAQVSHQGEITRSGEALYLSQEKERPSNKTGYEFLINLWESLFADPALWGPLVENIPLDVPLTQLSGGEWTRLRIAECLSHPCHLLILDEPTNNLDLHTRNFIYNFVENYKGSALLIISHDRQLLKRVHHILEMSNQGLNTYGGNYDFYANEKLAEAQRQELKLKVARQNKEKLSDELQQKQQRQKKRMVQGQRQSDKGGIPRLVAGRNKRRSETTQSKIKGDSEKRIVLAQEEFKTLWSKTKIESSIRLQWPDLKLPSSKKIFEIQKGNIFYSNTEKPLWTNPLSYILIGPEKLCLCGSNGSGKSSFIKALLGQISKKEILGSWRISHITYAFLDQEYKLLNTQHNVIENIQSSSDLALPEIRNQLAQFQFNAEKVYQKISTLSGGEKLKAALAKVLLMRPSPELIILDEPTNNLDINSLKVLEESLKQYKGAMIIISHDQDFLKNIGITKYLEIHR